jgi:hypothetical protein
MSRLTLARIKRRCEPDGDCLLWTGKVYANGHPSATEFIDGKDKYVGVRRRAYEEYHGVTLKPGQQVATCGHPACLAKAHLEVLTIAEKARRMHANMDAGRKRMRNRKIADTSREKLGKVTPEQVAAVRDSEEGPYVTARRLGINGVVASRIKNGESYRDYEVSPFAGLGARA